MYNKKEGHVKTISELKFVIECIKQTDNTQFYAVHCQLIQYSNNNVIFSNWIIKGTQEAMRIWEARDKDGKYFRSCIYETMEEAIEGINLFKNDPSFPHQIYPLFFTGS